MVGAAAAGTAPEVDPWVPVPHRVVERRSETADTATLVLAPEAPTAAAGFQPGQFNMLYAFGVGEIAVSISGDPADPARLLHTVRAAGRSSRAVAQAPTGSVLGVRGPYGRGWPLEAAIGKDVLVIAGGLGLPPLRPLLYRLIADRARFGRIEVIYGARTPEDLVYYEEVQRWRARPDLHFQTTVDRAGRAWPGDVGVVTQRLPDAEFDAQNTAAFLCGPEIMMRLGARAIEARGVPAGSIWLSLERNMKCAVGLCGHCQFGPDFVCRNGPVFRYAEIRRCLEIREL